LMPEPIFLKLGMYIIAPESISTAYFINPSHQTVCLYVYPPIVARQRLGKNVTAATNKRNNRRIVGRVVFCMVRVVSKESRRLVLPRTSCLLAYFPYLKKAKVGLWDHHIDILTLKFLRKLSICFSWFTDVRHLLVLLNCYPLVPCGYKNFQL
jgi:hypothetical protein